MHSSRHACAVGDFGCYLEQVEEKIVEQLLSAASFLQIDSVMDACSEVRSVAAHLCMLSHS